MQRSAVLAFPGADGEPQARLILERIFFPLDWAESTLYESDGPPRPPRTAAWLMCNPSKADHRDDDPTAGRVVHHSTNAGCPRSLVGNVWPLRTPYPADLWAALARGDLTPEMRHANLEALTMIGAQADIHIAAFGAAPGERDRVAVAQALEAFSLGHTVPIYCLGMTPAGQPLHPLARGKFAVRNNTELRIWKPAAPVRSWEEVFSDKVRTPSGWRDR